jgi:hypothetical protein
MLVEASDSDKGAGGGVMPEELPGDPVAILGALLLVGGSVVLLRWLDARTSRGGLERIYGGFLLVNLAAILPELTMTTTAMVLGDFRMAEGVLAASALWRVAFCGLLGMALPPARNPLLPGRSLANLLPAVAGLPHYRCRDSLHDLQ